MPNPLVTQIRRVLADNANPDKAAGMRRYMKSKMPYRGIQTPLRRRLCRDVFQAHPFEEKRAWRESVLELWRKAEYREERYAALALLGAREYSSFRSLDTLPLLEELVVTGAWWDYVDDIASHRLRELLEKHPAEMSREMRAWSLDPDKWKRRSSIICQLGRKQETDIRLLFDCIESNLADPDFFIRKGIGWALRSLAWTDLAVVESFIAHNSDEISPLSRREALKNAAKIRQSNQA
ncbi:MAG: DNA alkylation repair protein [Chloroflexi bacterium]|nr:DNA alkylation repair protein [Chloroflexota bacterium]MDE2701747.1 DNA alkylation repair protein [Chloroflexota bacterium]